MKRYIFLTGILIVLAGCTQTGEATRDGISFTYDPSFRTKTMMFQIAADHCGGYGRDTELVENEPKGDSSKDWFVSFACVDRTKGK